jgi:hypothetical protein
MRVHRHFFIVACKIYFRRWTGRLLSGWVRRIGVFEHPALDILDPLLHFMLLGGIFGSSYDVRRRPGDGIVGDFEEGEVAEIRKIFGKGGDVISTYVEHSEGY